MAVNWKDEHNRTSEYRFFPEDLKVIPELNGRTEAPNIEPLIADILERGQVTPIAIRNDGGKAVLVAGHLRWLAVSEINKRKLTPVKMQLRCCYLQCSDQEGFLANITENVIRSTTTELDDAHNIKLLLKWGMTEDQISKVYFPTAKEREESKAAIKWVKKRVALISLTSEARQAIKDGRVKITQATRLSKLSAEQQREVAKGTGKIDSKKLKSQSAKPTLKTAIKAIVESGKLPSGFKVSDEICEYLKSLLSK